MSRKTKHYIDKPKKRAQKLVQLGSFNNLLTSSNLICCYKGHKRTGHGVPSSCLPFPASQCLLFASTLLPCQQRGNPIITHSDSTPPVRSLTSQMFPIKKGGLSVGSFSLTHTLQRGKKRASKTHKGGRRERRQGREVKKRETAFQKCLCLRLLFVTIVDLYDHIQRYLLRFHGGYLIIQSSCGRDSSQHMRIHKWHLYIALVA